jgi:hypothetical protein
MDEHSWEAWTTPPTTEGFVLGYPEGRKLPGGPPGGWLGEIRATPKANDATIKFASRTWKQRKAKDFERTGRRRYVERATGVEYELCRGNVMLGDDPEAADCFFSEDGSLWFLRRADRSWGVRSEWMGEMGAVQR